MMAQECPAVEKLILIAPAFDAIGVRAREFRPTGENDGMYRLDALG